MNPTLMATDKEQDDFIRLISANKGIIVKICHSFCRNKTDREDLVQEIIFAIWKGRSTYIPDLRFSTWMYRVALNTAISHYRSAKKRPGEIVPFDEDHLEIEDPLSESSTLDENRSLLQRHIASLKELDRALIILYFE